MLDRTTAPKIHDAIEFDYDLTPIRQDQLDNGLPVYWINAGVQDVAEIDFVFPAGIWYEQKPAVAYAVGGLLKNGTSTKAAQEIHEAIEFYGASVKVSTGNDFASVTLHTLTRHLPAILPIVFELITDAVFPEKEVEIHKRNAIQRLLVNLRQCEFVANQRIDAVLFGEAHPYGRFSRKEKIEALTREDLLAFYKDHFALANMKIFMAGKIGEAEVASLNAVFGKAPITATVITNEQFSPHAPHAKKEQVINDPQGVQGAIRIGRSFPNRHHPDFAPMVVLNTLFGGYFGSRLMSNIREEKGFTYGIYSSVTPYMNGGSMIIHTEVGRDVIDAASEEIFKEMAILCEELVGDEELLLVKNYLLGGLLADLDGPFALLHRWRTLVLNDFTVDHFNRNISIYKNITAEELRELARRYFRKDDFYEVTVI